jgi:hypothetical protein
MFGSRKKEQNLDKGCKGGFAGPTCPSLVSASVKENVSGTRRNHFFFQEPSNELLSFARIHPSVSMVVSQARPVRGGSVEI